VAAVDALVARSTRRMIDQSHSGPGSFDENQPPSNFSPCKRLIESGQSFAGLVAKPMGHGTVFNFRLNAVKIINECLGTEKLHCRCRASIHILVTSQVHFAVSSALFVSCQSLIGLCVGQLMGLEQELELNISHVPVTAAFQYVVVGIVVLCFL